LLRSASLQTIEEIGQATDKVVDSAATLHQAAQNLCSKQEAFFEGFFFVSSIG